MDLVLILIRNFNSYAVPGFPVNVTGMDMGGGGGGIYV